MVGDSVIAPQGPAPVSVVIPCYRCIDTIGRALTSVYQQTWRPAEVLLVEDDSGDGTLKRLQELQAEYPAGWIHVVALQSNGGPGVARNMGWDKASQPYLAFLDADDAWHPEKVRLQLGWMLAHPGTALTAHAVQVASGEPGQEYTQAPANMDFRRVPSLVQLLSSRFHPQATILQRELPYRFVADKRQSEDYLLFTEICLDGHECCRSPVPLTFLFKAHYGVSGLTGNLWLIGKGELDFYVRLARAGRIPRASLLFFIPFSLAKHMRRMCKVLLRRWFA
jgi:glycosyltransferase involved in cell wall biosynthesis